MPDPSLLFVCLAVISGCAVAMTVTMAWTARDLRRTLRRVDTLLPSADRALREAHRAIDHVRRMLLRADQASRRVEGVVRRACDSAEETLNHWLGNRAGADPRRHHRNGSSR